MHEPTTGATDEWYTPPEMFTALGIPQFDLDPCSPGIGHWVPAKHIYTKEDDGLVQPWFGTVFVNPPFGGRRSHVPWVLKFLKHANGICLVRAYTSADWFHEWAIKAETMVFPRGKTKFVKPDGSVGPNPGHGIVLLGMGEIANTALMNCGLGLCIMSGGGAFSVAA